MTFLTPGSLSSGLPMRTTTRFNRLGPGGSIIPHIFRAIARSCHCWRPYLSFNTKFVVMVIQPAFHPESQF
jgi:hypothetical protein